MGDDLDRATGMAVHHAGNPGQRGARPSGPQVGAPGVAFGVPAKRDAKAMSAIKPKVAP